MKIRAALLREVDTPFLVETLELAPPEKGEVRVRMKAAGVCHSDWSLRTGATRHPLPVVPGHEGAGIVDAVGEGVESVRPGDPVVLNWAPNCGDCFYCNNGRPSLCATYVDPIWAGGMMDGTTRLSKDGETVYHYTALACFAEAAVVPHQSCVPVPKELPLEIGALIGCAVTTGVGAVLNTAKVDPGSTVAVFGLGGVGLSAVLGAKLAGASKIIGVDREGEKAALAEALGVDSFLVAGETTVSRIREETEGRGADTVIEATGIPEVQERSLEAARPGGMVVLSGLAPMGSSTNFPGALLTRQEKAVVGSYYGTAHPQRDFPRLAGLYLEGKLDLDRLISTRYGLEEINEAFEAMRSGKQGRGVILFQ
ncbi:MAG: alcohol dehydrogenase catalytic domain-containing protein [Planctomycetota bacterium]